MQMASSSLLSLSLLVLFLLVSISPAYTRKQSLLNGFNQNPIRTIVSTAGVSENLLSPNRMEGKNAQHSGKSQDIRVGPWGAQVSSSNGQPFDDGVYTGIRQIDLMYNNETAIGGLQVTYDLNGSPFVAENHTSFLSDGFTLAQIILDFPEEFVTVVSGHIGTVEGYAETVIRSLTFKTNKKIYGPYGATRGTPFVFPIQKGLIIGLKGSVGYWLDYIEFYLSL